MSNAPVLSPTFTATDITVLKSGGDRQIWSYMSNWKGKDRFHVREVYYANDCWNPGKGVSVPDTDKSTFCAALGKLAASPAKPIRSAKQITSAK